MDVLEAMEAVTKCLLAQDLIGAQHQVLNIEANGSVLPSSTFERVLKAAVHANCLLPAYREFCERSYGRQQFTDLLKSADGRTFHVGSDCVAKTGDKKLIDAAKVAQRKRDAVKRTAKAADVRRELNALLDREDVRELLSTKQRPQPIPGWSEEMNSLLSYVIFLAGRGGAAGRLRALRLVKAEVE